MPTNAGCVPAVAARTYPIPSPDAVAAAVRSLECHEAYLADLPHHPRPAEFIPAMLAQGGTRLETDAAVLFRAYHLG